MTLAQRAAGIAPFHVMGLLAQARKLEAEGRDLVHMEIGEPDFPTQELIVAAGVDALGKGHTHYTPASGLPALREQIAAHYHAVYGLQLAPERVIVTPGGSGALQLALLACLDVGDEVLVTDPGYPCNRQIALLTGAKPVSVPVGVETGYKLTPELLNRHWTPRTKAVLLASPGNPTGSVLSLIELRELARSVRRHHSTLIVDEIYHGLTYGVPSPTALTADENSYVVNSFSKFYGMTGWRLGWLVAPESAASTCERMAQNLFLAAPTVAQHAALAAFAPKTRLELVARKNEFQRRRDYLVPALKELGFGVAQPPAGAFYVYADASVHTDDCEAFCQKLLHEAGVVVTPGIDFGEYHARSHVRFAFTTTLPRIEEGVARLRRYLTAEAPASAAS